MYPDQEKERIEKLKGQSKWMVSLILFKNNMFFERCKLCEADGLDFLFPWKDLKSHLKICKFNPTRSDTGCVKLLTLSR